MCLFGRCVFTPRLFILLLAAIPAFATPLNICLLSGSFEYDSDIALGGFKAYLEDRYAVECTLLEANGWEDVPGLEALDSAEVLLVYARRLSLPPGQLDRIRAFVEAGKPVVGVRTASHAFQGWLEFDAEVLGGNYQNHLQNGPTTGTRVEAGKASHPILEGVGSLRSRYSLYKNTPLPKGSEALLSGSIPGYDAWEPVAWTRSDGAQRVFYTSLGGVSDFENAGFQRMMANALYWVAARAPEPKPLPEVLEAHPHSGDLRFACRSREEEAGAPDPWVEKTAEKRLPVRETAIIVCDMWDLHWCPFASDRVAAMAPVMNDVLNAARLAGVQIIHAPSDTMPFYADTPQRRRVLEAPRVTPAEHPLPEEPPLPIDDSDGGCPVEAIQYGAWTRQHPGILIREPDAVSDDGAEVYNFLQSRGIKHLLVMGVHTNMCVLGRSFAIRQMTRWGIDCYLVRDLTDTMYDPADAPRVPHDRGTELVVEHIEKYLAPSLTSEDLVAGLPKYPKR